MINLLLFAALLLSHPLQAATPDLPSPERLAYAKASADTPSGFAQAGQAPAPPAKQLDIADAKPACFRGVYDFKNQNLIRADNTLALAGVSPRPPCPSHEPSVTNAAPAQEPK